jgi:hypothetical protein
LWSKGETKQFVILGLDQSPSTSANEEMQQTEGATQSTRVLRSASCIAPF